MELGYQKLPVGFFQQVYAVQELSDILSREGYHLLWSINKLCGKNLGWEKRKCH